MQPEVADQAPGAEPPDVADCGQQRRRDHHVDPRDGHQPADVGHPDRLGGDQLVDLRELVAEEVQLAQPGLEGQALVDRQLLLGQPRPSLDSERSAAGGRPRGCDQHRGDLVLDLGARLTSCAGARPPPQHPDAVIADPDPVESPGRQQVGQRRASILSVFARAWRMPVSLASDDHLGDMRLQDPRDRPARSRSPPTRPDPRLEALANSSSASGRVAIRPADRAGPPRRSPPRRSRDGRPALPLSPDPPRSSTRGEPVGKRHRRIRARSATRQVAGAATEKPGLKAHRAKRPAQPAFSRRPLSQSPEPKPTPDDTGAFNEQFHAATSGKSAASGAVDATLRRSIRRGDGSRRLEADLKLRVVVRAG